MLVDLGTYYICTISLQGGWSNPPADNVQANLVWHRWMRHYLLAWYRLVEVHGLGITSEEGSSLLCASQQAQTNC